MNICAEGRQEVRTCGECEHFVVEMLSDEQCFLEGYCPILDKKNGERVWIAEFDDACGAFEDSTKEAR